MTARRQHIFALLQRQNLAPDDPRGLHPAGHADGKDDQQEHDQAEKGQEAAQERDAAAVGIFGGWALAALGAGAVLLAFVFPGQTLSPSASNWLPLHLLFGVASYGLFGTAVVHAWFMTRAETRMRQAADPHSGLPLLTLERLTYRFVMAGFVLLSATLVMGFGFGDVVYGPAHAWRWDHKTVFSVLSWLTFAVLLAGRHQFGWRGKQANRMLYIGSVLLLLAYVGSRFVLEVILGRGA